MRNSKLTAFLGVVALVGTACGPTPTASSPTPSAAPPAASPAAAVASPSPAPAERVDGVVQTVAGGQLTLTSGRGFTLPASARVLRSVPITPTDLKPGDYVAITAKRQPDNTLLASIVNVFPPSLGQVAPGQRPMPEGNLMTNATIDQVQGTGFTASFPGGGARVQLAPDARLARLVEASVAELQPGDTISAQVANEEARSVTIQPGGSPQPAASPAASSATVQVRAAPRLGSILADGQGRTLYRFDRDTPGASACSGGCAQTWTPLQASGTPTGPADLPGRLGTLERPDGGRQVTYNETPLYTYAADTQPGDAKGDDVGGNWHVAHP